MAEYRFWCCQPEAERTIASGLAVAFTLSALGPVPSAFFDTAWLAVFKSRDGRKDVFEQGYRTRRTVLIDPTTGDPIPAIEPSDPIWWAAFILWLSTPAADCTDGCDKPRWAAS